MKRVQGFTLIELMVTVVILGLLAAIALPSYQKHVVKSNRAAAQAFMLEVVDREKQYLLDARAYAPDLATLRMTTPANVSKFYTLSIAAVASPPGFTISASPITGSSQEADGALTLDDAGVKTPAGKW